MRSGLRRLAIGCALLLLGGAPSGALGAAAMTQLPPSTGWPLSARSAHGERKALEALYAPPGTALLWSVEQRPTPQARALLAILLDVADLGLRPQDYAAAALADALRVADTAQASGAQASETLRAELWRRLDAALTLAALRLLCDLHYGRIAPAAAAFHLPERSDDLDLAVMVRRLAAAGDVRAVLSSAEPAFVHYRLLEQLLPRYRALAAHAPRAPLRPQHSVRPGQPYEDAAALRALLAALDDLPAAAATAQPGLLDATLVQGLRHFQSRHGLRADGVLGKDTVTALQVPLSERVRQLELTLERWRWLPPFEQPPLIVNIPQFRLFAFRSTLDRREDILQMDVIVGRTYVRTQTPVFEASLRYVVFRPFWDVPYSITHREMLPKLRADPGYLASQHLQIVQGAGDDARVLTPTAQSVQLLAAGGARLRQEPGADNALGLVKFMLPNANNVYLHATPAHALFAEPQRAFSHGCIRVSDPVALAVHVLRQTPGDWTAQKVRDAMAASSSSRVTLAQPVPVLILYGTALATEAGEVLFFPDLYGHDRRLERLLGLPAV